MSSIKFNQLTKEIEMTGPESFIELNFDKIRDLTAESFGVKEEMLSKEAKKAQEPIAVVKINASQTSDEITVHELSQTSPKAQTRSAVIPEISHDLKPTRPPLRKYIRKVGIPGGHERIVVEVVEQKPREISIASLKEKFGLSEAKIGKIIRDAEEFGKIKRVMNGSYVWSQD